MVGGCLLLFFILLSGSSRAAPHDEHSSAETKVTVTDEQREYLRWLYRIEDQTVWKFVLLGLAFVCLLVGFLLLGMGAMASRNRRKIGKYKAAVAAAAAAGHKDEDETWPGGRDGALACGGTPSPRSPTRRGPPPCNGDTGDVKAASIVVTWKDGNTSCLYPESEAHVEAEVEVGPPLPDDDDDDEYRVRREVGDKEDKEDEEDEVKDGGDR